MTWKTILLYTDVGEDCARRTELAWHPTAAPPGPTTAARRAGRPGPGQWRTPTRAAP